jgi:hypothetical protein
LQNKAYAYLRPSKPLTRHGTHPVLGRSIPAGLRPPVEDSAVERVYATVGRMNAEPADFNSKKNMIEYYALEQYLKDPQEAWARLTDHGTVENDIEVFDNSVSSLPPFASVDHARTVLTECTQNPTYVRLQGTKRIVIVSGLNALGVERTLRAQQPHWYFVSPSMWAKELSTTLGAEPFIFFIRKGRDYNMVTYAGQFYLRSTQESLTAKDWERMPAEVLILVFYIRRLNS